jgi:hypothetical protein
MSSMLLAEWVPLKGAGSTVSWLLIDCTARVRDRPLEFPFPDEERMK